MVRNPVERAESHWNHLLRQVRACDTLDDLVDVALTFNDNCIPPLSEGQVVKTAKSAWKIEDDDRNWVGGPAQVVFPTADVNRLKHDPNAFTYLAMLKAAHGGRREPFALAARAMRREEVMPGWGRNKYMQVTNTLIESGDLVRVHEGGKHPGDGPHLYTLRTWP